MNPSTPTTVSPLTDEEIATLRDLDAAAERGPWATRYNHLRVFKAYSDRREVWPIEREGKVLSAARSEQLANNARLIAAMRTALPRLLAKLDTLTRERDQAREERDAARANLEMTYNFFATPPTDNKEKE